jgi:hypothetical protein
MGGFGMRRVCVQWKDSISASGWRSSERLDEFIQEDNTLHESIGYLYEWNENVVVLAQSYGLYEDGNIADVIKIPKDSVVWIRSLTLGTWLMRDTNELEL